MAATLARGPLELSETERQRQRVVQGEAQGMGGLTRVQDQTTSLEQVQESREVAKERRDRVQEYRVGESVVLYMEFG